MNVSSLLDELDEMIDSAWNMPLSGGKALVDAERVREIVDKIRSSLPQEIRQAKAIVSDRSQIIADAKREAETVVRVAEERARVMVKDEIVRQAQARGSELLSQSQTKAREIRRAANEYVDDLMKRTDEQMTANLAELRKTRQNLKASQRSGNQ
ncbi:MAG: ATPase [[Clostridium] leptum]